uniref:Uncharacterized protein n=1 Tax=Solanum tuberosum TaxID=4113 RepID=M1CTH8_SOLTU
MQLWTEIPARFTIVEEGKEKPVIQQLSRIYPEDKRGESCGVSRRPRGEVLKRNFVGPTLNSKNLGQKPSNAGPIVQKHTDITNPPVSSKRPMNFNEPSCDNHMAENKGLTEIKDLAAKFLEAFRNWETNTAKETSMATQVDGGERNSSCIQTEPGMIGSQQTSHEKGGETNDTQSTEQDMQLQHIHDAEPVNFQLPNSQEDCETEASNWVNSHILDLSNTYGVAFEGFER